MREVSDHEPEGMRRRSFPEVLAWLLLTLLAGGLVVSCANSPVTPGASARGADGQGEKLVVSAASDLAPVLDRLVPMFRERTGLDVELNLGSTGQLAQQISAGAPVDVFLSASRQAVDDLQREGRLLPGSQAAYAIGRLTLWTRPGRTPVTTLGELRRVDVRRVAIANPDHAPYGIAARQALIASGLWEEVQPKLVLAENIRQAFQFAQSGNVDVGLVALSLVVFSGEHYGLVPERLHEPLVQVLAIPASSRRQAEARRFAAFLRGEEGRRVLEAFGFVVPPAQGSTGE